MKEELFTDEAGENASILDVAEFEKLLNTTDKINDGYIKSLFSSNAIDWDNGTPDLADLVKVYFKWSKKDDDSNKAVTSFIKEIAKMRQNSTYEAPHIQEISGGYHLVHVVEGVRKVQQLTDFTISNVRKTLPSNSGVIYVVDAHSKGKTLIDMEFSSEVFSKISDMRSLFSKLIDGTLEYTISPKAFGTLVEYIKNLPYKNMKMIQRCGHYYDEEKKPYMVYLKKDVEDEDDSPSHIGVISDGDIKVPNLYYPISRRGEADYVYPNCNEEDWKSIAKTLLSHGPFMGNPINSTILMAWIFASPLRHLVKREATNLPKFPVLHIVGSPGSGKTIMTEMMLSTIGFMSEFASFSKEFVLVKSLAESNSHTMWIDEFKVVDRRSALRAEVLYDMIRRAYNNGKDERGTSDQKKNVYRMLRPLIVSGESAFSDQATLERTIKIEFLKSDIDGVSNEHYEEMSKQTNKLPYFAKRFHEWLLSSHEEWEEWIVSSRKESNAAMEGVSNRPSDNPTWILVGIKMINMLCDVVGIPHSISPEMNKNILDHLKDVAKMTKKTDDLDAIVAHFLAENWHSGGSVERKDDGIIMGQADWIKNIRDYVSDHTNKGEQSVDIIKRTLGDMERNGSIQDIGKTVRINGRLSRSFTVIVTKICDNYDIPRESWEKDDIPL